MRETVAATAVEPQRTHTVPKWLLSSSLRPAPAVLWWVLGLVLLVLATVPFPDSGVWIRARGFLVQAMGTVLAGWTIGGGDWPRERVVGAARCGLNRIILAFLIWISVSALLSPFPFHSHYEVMRYVGGILTYAGIVYAFQSKQSRRLAVMLAWIAIIGALEAFILTGNQGSGRISGAFLDEQLFAGFACVLFPITLAGARAESAPSRRLLCLAAATLCAIALIATRNRSTWAGSIVALAVLLTLYWRYERSRRSHRMRWQDGLLIGTTAILTVGIFLGFSSYGDTVVRRLSSFSVLKADNSWEWRLDAWRAALRMAYENPVMGRGIGTFALHQPLYLTGVSEQRVVASRGPTLWESAHNSYVQLAGETGFVGVGLYLAIYAAFFGTGLAALRRPRLGNRRFLVMGSMAAIAGQMVSACGSPAWEYPECSVLFWTVLALGMLAAGIGERGTPAEAGASSGRRRRRRRAHNPSPEVDER